MRGSGTGWSRGAGGVCGRCGRGGGAEKKRVEVAGRTAAMEGEVSTGLV